MTEEEIIKKEPEEAIIPDEELDFELEDTEDVEVLKAQIEKDAQAKKQLVARAKKAEEENRLLKKPKEPTATQQQPASLNVEETVLLANGMDEALLENLKKVAQVQGISLIKAQSDPIFVAIKEQFEKEKLDKKASIGPSRGSGQLKPKKDFKSPGLSEKEHREMFDAQFNR